MGKKRCVYLDNNATTRVDPHVLNIILKCLRGLYGNPSASYDDGKLARRAIEYSRTVMGNILGVRDPANQLFFTSGATESNIIALRGRVAHYASASFRPHVITTSIEHSSVYETVRDMEGQGLCTVTYLSVDRDGFVDLKELDRVLTTQKNTVLVSIIVANNEIGTIQPMEKLVAICRKHTVKCCKGHGRIHVHADITQTVGKYKIDLEHSGFDSASFSAHKFNGPKGVGGLYLRDCASIRTCATGGKQEHNIRAGTENTAYIVGMAKALSISHTHMRERRKHIEHMRDWLQAHLVRVLPQGARINANVKDRLYNTISLSVPAWDNTEMLDYLNGRGIYLNVGSACSKGGRSRVLEAIHLPIEYEKGTLRISLCDTNTMKECKYLVDTLAAKHRRLWAVVS